ncbi:MAG: transglutaminase-like domain-containing protein [Bdellovibrionota bacterium]
MTTLRQYPYAVPKGEAGVLETLGRMAMVIWHCSHSTRLAAFARELIGKAGVEAYDGRGEIKALFDWVTKNIRYTRDPYGYEWIQSVVPTLVFGHGDCDCHTVLLGSLLMSVGYPVRLVIVGNSPGNFHHVFLSTEYRGPLGNPIKIDLDSTIPEGKGFDKAPNFPIRREFQILPQGKLKEAEMNEEIGVHGYGLGEYLSDIGKPSLTVKFHLSTGKVFTLPWGVHDLEYVSDAERRAWILKEFDPQNGKWTLAERAEISQIIERMEGAPGTEGLGELDGFLSALKKIGKGIKSTVKAVGKGLKTAVGSIPIVGKPIVGIAKGIKDVVKAPYVGIKAALKEPKKTLKAAVASTAASAASALKPGQIATTPEGAPLYSADGGETFVQSDGTPYPKGHPVMILPGAVPPAPSREPDLFPEAAPPQEPVTRQVQATEVKKARLEIAPGTPEAIPEVKSEGTKKIALALGGVGLAGAAAYAYTRMES